MIADITIDYALTPINLKFYVVSEYLLRIEAYDNENYRRWFGQYDKKFFDTVGTHLQSSKNAWNFAMSIIKMKNNPEDDKKTNEVFNIEIMAQSQGKDQSGSDIISKREIVVLQYIGRGFRFSIPCPITPAPYAPEELIEILKEVKHSQTSQQSLRFKSYETQIQEMNQSFMEKNKDYEDIIAGLKNENNKLKDELRQKDDIIKRLKDDLKQRDQTPQRMNAKAPRVTSTYTRNKQKESPSYLRTSTYSTRRTVGSKAPRVSGTSSRKSSAASSRGPSPSSSRRSSSVGSVKNSARSSAGNSRTNSRAPSVRSSSSASSRNTSRSSSPHFKRFDPTKWKEERQKKRQSSSPRRSFY